MMDDLISVVVPVFNVENELDICLKSIIEQTYLNLEIILVNDGSTDSSGMICKKWAKKDPRIIYVKKNNEGLGPARNLGIRISKGDYIAFVDSDDWVDKKFIEKMYERIKTQNADMVICDYYKVQNNNTSYQISNIGDCTQEEIVKKMELAGSQIWTKLIRREVLIENKIFMPSIPYEDFAVNDVIILSCKRITAVKEALYFYRYNRTGSISNISGNHIYFIQAAQYLLDELRKRNLYDMCEPIVIGQIVSRMKTHYVGAEENLGQKEFKQLQQKYFEFLQVEPALKKYFEIITKKSKFFGSYSLARMGNCINWKSDIQEDRYNFSSIISLMSEGRSIREEIHTSSYRVSMIKKDYEKSFWKDIEGEVPEFLFIDFLEERFDILQCQESFFTKSDAWEGCSMADDNSYEIISRTGTECRELWETSCEKFVTRLKKYFKPNQIILVKNYLCTSYGDGEELHTFDQLDWIVEMNKLLESYYQYFIDMFQGIHTIESRENIIYTEKLFKYGVYPWHYNRLMYMEIAYKIKQIID